MPGPRQSRKRRGAGDGPEPLGVLYVDKPAGPTSAEVCDFIRWVLRTRSVGHCGTLDPGATGLLVCCVGPATKLVPLLTDADKTYRGRFVLGAATTTADAAGEVIARAPVDDATWKRAPEVLRAMVGPQELEPPAFSAVRIDGERAHEKARRGEVVDMPKRTMIIHAVDDVRLLAPGELEATLRVSKGSFIRSIAVELGARLGVPAHLGALHRVGSGNGRLDHPKALAHFDVSPIDPRPDGKPRHRIRIRDVADDREAQGRALLERLVDPAEVLGIPALEVSHDAQGEDLVRRLGHGQPVAADHPALAGLEPQGMVAVRAGAGLVLGTFEGADADVVLRVSRTLSPLAFEAAQGS